MSNESKIPTPDENNINKVALEEEEPKEEYRVTIAWRSVIVMSLIHIGALVGLYRAYTSAKVLTLLLALLFYVFSLLGITIGAHRLWAHRCYKARLPLRVVIMLFNCMAYQNSIYEWSRDHRVHHKYSETNADPHNAKRGFFFAHMGWLMCKKHPDVIEKGRTIDMSDLMDDPVVAFQHRHYFILMPLISFILPALIAPYLWGETYLNSYLIVCLLRWVSTSHMTWLVNSAAHLYGSHPYDRFINPGENRLVTIVVFGEAWHNYHHTFPWDYKAAEFGSYWGNFGAKLIEFFEKMGWAYNLRSVSKDIVERRVQRTGDGSHDVWGKEGKKMLSGEEAAALIDYSDSKKQW